MFMFPERSACLDRVMSNKDLRYVAMDIGLGRDNLLKLFMTLGIDCENPVRIADTRDYKIQSYYALRSWRQQNGMRATRKKMIDMLAKCKFNLSKHKLEKKWRFHTAGKHIIRRNIIKLIL